MELYAKSWSAVHSEWYLVDLQRNGQAVWETWMDHFTGNQRIKSWNTAHGDWQLQHMWWNRSANNVFELWTTGSIRILATEVGLQNKEHHHHAE